MCVYNATITKARQNTSGNYFNQTLTRDYLLRVQFKFIVLDVIVPTVK